MNLESAARSQFRDADAYRADRIAHWDAVASSSGERRGPARTYHRRLADVYRFLLPPGLRVLELGSSHGDLLNSLQPAFGVGVDFSPIMIEKARQRHAGLQFVEADAHHLSQVTGTFDAILLSDLLHDVWDVQELLTGLPRLCHPGTRLIMNFYSRLWEPPLTAARRIGLARAVLKQNWLTASDVTNLLYLSDFRVVRAWQEVLFPFPCRWWRPYATASSFGYGVFVTSHCQILSWLGRLRPSRHVSETLASQWLFRRAMKLEMS